MVSAEVTADPSVISAPQAKDEIKEVSVPVTDAGIQTEQPNLLANDVEEIIDESPSHDFQQVVEGEAETGEVQPTFSIRNLVGGDPSSTKMLPAEGIFLFSFFFLY